MRGTRAPPTGPTSPLATTERTARSLLDPVDFCIRGRGDEVVDSRTVEAEPKAPAHATRALVLLNVGVYLAMVVYSRTPVAALRIPGRTLLVFGANSPIFTVAENRFETLLSSCFLHGSLLHIAFNLVVLWRVGPFLERSVGAARFVPLYLVAGVVGSAVSSLYGYLTDGVMSVGASGAVCGLVGGVLVLGLRTEGKESPLARAMARWLALTLLIGLVSRLDAGPIGRIDNAAHVGGAIGGAFVAALWRRGLVYSKGTRAATLAVSCVVVLAAGATVVVRDTTDPFVLLGRDERIQVAATALWEGRCGDAEAAARRAERIDPRSRDIEELKRNIARRCGR